MGNGAGAGAGVGVGGCGCCGLFAAVRFFVDDNIVTGSFGIKNSWGHGAGSENAMGTMRKLGVGSR